MSTLLVWVEDGTGLPPPVSRLPGVGHPGLDTEESGRKTLTKNGRPRLSDGDRGVRFRPKPTLGTDLERNPSVRNGPVSGLLWCGTLSRSDLEPGVGIQESIRTSTRLD